MMHLGEGDYDEAERIIQGLLAEKETSEDKSAIRLTESTP